MHRGVIKNTSKFTAWIVHDELLEILEHSPCILHKALDSHTVYSIRLWYEVQTRLNVYMSIGELFLFRSLQALIQVFK